jgi:hypothetical protein
VKCAVLARGAHVVARRRRGPKLVPDAFYSYYVQMRCGECD